MRGPGSRSPALCYAVDPAGRPGPQPRTPRGFQPQPRGHGGSPRPTRTRSHEQDAATPRADAPHGDARARCPPAPRAQIRALPAARHQVRYEHLCNRPGATPLPPPHLRQDKVKFKIETNYLASAAPRPPERGPRRRAHPRPSRGPAQPAPRPGPAWPGPARTPPPRADPAPDQALTPRPGPPVSRPRAAPGPALPTPNLIPAPSRRPDPSPVRPSPARTDPRLCYGAKLGRGSPSLSLLGLQCRRVTSAPHDGGGGRAPGGGGGPGPPPPPRPARPAHGPPPVSRAARGHRPRGGQVNAPAPAGPPPPQAPQAQRRTSGRNRNRNDLI